MSESAADPEPDAAESLETTELSTDEAMKAEETQSEGKEDKAPEESTDGEHTCSECGMTFPRRYSLIMHSLKHEKARGYKCTVSTTAALTLSVYC